MGTPCANCENVHDSKFCPECGQKRIRERITFHESVKHILQATFNLDRGFLHTFLILLNRPHEVLRTYLNGGTLTYFPPFRYVLVAMAINTFLLFQFNGIGLSQEEIMSAMGQVPTEEAMNAQSAINNYMRDYMTLVLVLLSPLSAWVYYVFYRRHNYYFGEHVAIYFFLYGQVVLLNSLIFLVFFVTGLPMLWFMFITAVLPVIYFSFAHSKFFSISAGRAVLTNIFAQTVSMLMAFVVITTVMMLYQVFAEISA